MAKKKEEGEYDIFTHWKYLCSKNEGWKEHDEDFVSSYNVYMQNRLASMLDILLPVVADVGRYDMPKEAHFRFMDALLPKRYLRVDYIKPKNTNDLDSKYVSDYFEFGSRDCKVAMSLLGKEHVEEIKKKYGGKDVKIS